MNEPLSPAAQAVEDAYFNADGFGYRNGLAAALRAAVDLVEPRRIRAELLAIAAELEEQLRNSAGASVGPIMNDDELEEELTPSYEQGEITCKFTEAEVDVLSTILDVFSEDHPPGKDVVFDSVFEKSRSWTQVRKLYDDNCIKYELSPAPTKFYELYGTYGTENDVERAKWGAYQAGADQELEACCEWLRSKDILEPAIDALRAARRPKPPSLRKQAYDAVERLRYAAGWTADEGGWYSPDGVSEHGWADEGWPFPEDADFANWFRAAYHYEALDAGVELNPYPWAPASQV